MAVKSFTTFNGFAFEWMCEPKPSHHERVTMRGAVTKVVYEGDDHARAAHEWAEAQRVYAEMERGTP